MSAVEGIVLVHAAALGTATFLGHGFDVTGDPNH